MGRVYEKWHICKCLVFHAENLVKVYTQKNSGYTKSRRKIRQQKIPKINSKFLHIEVLSREAWASKDTRFLTLSQQRPYYFCSCAGISNPFQPIQTAPLLHHFQMDNPYLLFRDRPFHHPPDLLLLRICSHDSSPFSKQKQSRNTVQFRAPAPYRCNLFWYPTYYFKYSSSS